MSPENLDFRSEHGSCGSKVLSAFRNRFFISIRGVNLIFDICFKILRIDFPREVIKGETLFTNMIIDETTSRPENNCDDVFVYITDTIKPGKI